MGTKEQFIMLMTRRKLVASAGAVAAATVVPPRQGKIAAAQAPLKLQLYTADDAGFLVNSAILAGEREAILIDAQFSFSHAHRLVADLLEAGKQLVTVYITHPHPDHYFGIEVIKSAFPKASVVAIAPVAAAIERAFAGKIAQWSPRLGANGPTRVSLPTPLAENVLTLEGHPIELVGPVQGDSANNTFLWIPSLATVIAGDTVFAGTHVWTASSDRAERAQWLKTLDRIEALRPQVVVPGHIKPAAPLTLAAVSHTRDYIAAFDQVVASTTKSGDVIKAMKARYPDLHLAVALELGAKVAAGEMPKWD
jgi:glyoxylase-like metal-dependent hydrolase (beta-lactamase superfamily II)